MKRLVIILVILLGILQYRLWFASDGLVETIHLKRAIAAQNQKIDSLEKSNSDLKANIGSLKKSAASIENHARKDLGMVKKGEVFYQIVQPKK